MAASGTRGAPQTSTASTAATPGVTGEGQRKERKEPVDLMDMIHRIINPRKRSLSGLHSKKAGAAFVPPRSTHQYTPSPAGDGSRMGDRTPAASGRRTVACRRVLPPVTDFPTPNTHEAALLVAACQEASAAKPPTRSTAKPWRHPREHEDEHVARKRPCGSSSSGRGGGTEAEAAVLQIMPPPSPLPVCQLNFPSPTPLRRAASESSGAATGGSDTLSENGGQLDHDDAAQSLDFVAATLAAAVADDTPFAVDDTSLCGSAELMVEVVPATLMSPCSSDELPGADSPMQLELSDSDRPASTPPLRESKDWLTVAPAAIPPPPPQQQQPSIQHSQPPQQPQQPAWASFALPTGEQAEAMETAEAAEVGQVTTESKDWLTVAPAAIPPPQPHQQQPSIQHSQPPPSPRATVGSIVRLPSPGADVGPNAAETMEAMEPVEAAEPMEATEHAAERSEVAAAAAAAADTVLVDVDVLEGHQHRHSVAPDMSVYASLRCSPPRRATPLVGEEAAVAVDERRTEEVGTGEAGMETEEAAGIAGAVCVVTDSHHQLGVAQAASDRAAGMPSAAPKSVSEGPTERIGELEATPSRRPDDWGLPPAVAAELGVPEMHAWQAECLAQPGVSDGGNLVFTAPTSAGKSLVADVLVLRNLIRTSKLAIICLPFVALYAPPPLTTSHSKWDTHCTTRSLIPTITGNTVRSFCCLYTGNCPQPRKLDHGLTL
jgi:hypothetical protein